MEETSAQTCLLGKRRAVHFKTEALYAGYSIEDIMRTDNVIAFRVDEEQALSCVMNLQARSHRHQEMKKYLGGRTAALRKKSQMAFPTAGSPETPGWLQHKASRIELPKGVFLVKVLPE